MKNKKVIKGFVFPFSVESDDVWFIVSRSRGMDVEQYCGVEGKKDLFNTLRKQISFYQTYTEFMPSEKVYMIKDMELVEVPIVDLLDHLNNINFINLK